MKKLYITLVVVLAIYNFSYGQYWSNGSATTGPINYMGGNVGIGIAPAASLDVKGIIRSTSGGLEVGKFGIASNPKLSIGIDQFEFGNSAIINGWNNNLNPGISVGTIRNDGTAFSVVTGVELDGNHLPVAAGNIAFRILGNGKVGIGTINPDETLTVNGKIHAKEVRIDTSIPTVPDYVFNKDYSLLSLTEVKNYIDKHHHLPEVPSAAEVEKDGLKLAEMNLILLKKVEELTLHLIEKDRKEKLQEEINNTLQKQIDGLKRL